MVSNALKNIKHFRSWQHNSDYTDTYGSGGSIIANRSTNEDIESHGSKQSLQNPLYERGTYKTIVRLFASYAALVNAPNMPYKFVKATENFSLRTITGYHAITNEDHLHQETNILLNKEAHCYVDSTINVDSTKSWPHIDPRTNAENKEICNKQKCRNCLNYLPPPASIRC